MVAWKRGIAILTAGSVKVTPDPRVRLVSGFNLQIRDAVPQDAGDYICQIATMEPREITHTVEILGKYWPPIHLPLAHTHLPFCDLCYISTLQVNFPLFIVMQSFQHHISVIDGKGEGKGSKNRFLWENLCGYHKSLGSIVDWATSFGHLCRLECADVCVCGSN